MIRAFSRGLRSRWVEAVEQLLAGPLQPCRVNAKLERWAARIAPFIEADIASGHYPPRSGSARLSTWNSAVAELRSTVARYTDDIRQAVSCDRDYAADDWDPVATDPGQIVRFPRSNPGGALFQGRRLLSDDEKAMLNARGLDIQPGLLTPAECELLIAQALPLLEGSETTGDDGVRSSSSAWLPWTNSSFHARIDAKLSGLIGLPARHSELAQVSRYSEGQSYALHVDDDPGEDGSPILGRIGTVVVFLNTLPAGAGGETIFTHDASDFSQSGGGTAAARARFSSLCAGAETGPESTIRPERGKAVAWRTFGADHQFFANTSHGGCPVRAGAKFVLQKWFLKPDMAMPASPLLDHPRALAYLPLGAADHLLRSVNSTATMLGDFGRQDIGIRAQLDPPGARSIAGPLPATSAVELGPGQVLRVSSPESLGELSASMWFKVERWAQPVSVPLLSLGDDLGAVHAVVRACIPGGQSNGRLVLCDGQACDCAEGQMAEFPLTEWVHLGFAVQKTAASAVLHDLGMRRLDRAAADTQSCVGERSWRTVTVGGAAHVSELRLFSGGLSDEEMRSTALSVHVLDPLGSKAVSAAYR